MPPKKELKHPSQVENLLKEWGSKLNQPARLVLIGSGGLLWHAYQAGKDIPLPSNSMDIDPISHDDAIAELALDCMIGSDFEKMHGFHVNLMPASVLNEMPEGWEKRVSTKEYGNLIVTVPSANDLLVPKLKRGEPRDFSHAVWAKQIGIASIEIPAKIPLKESFLKYIQTPPIKDPGQGHDS